MFAPQLKLDKDGTMEKIEEFLENSASLEFKQKKHKAKKLSGNGTFYSITHVNCYARVQQSL
jgi:hypothetical protein